MAIDSREKRASVVGINILFGPSPTPNASKDQEWRQEVGYGYPGIAAGAPVIPTAPDTRVHNTGAHGLLGGQFIVGPRGL